MVDPEANSQPPVPGFPEVALPEQEAMRVRQFGDWHAKLVEQQQAGQCDWSVGRMLDTRLDSGEVVPSRGQVAVRAGYTPGGAPEILVINLVAGTFISGGAPVANAVRARAVETASEADVDNAMTTSVIQYERSGNRKNPHITMPASETVDDPLVELHRLISEQQEAGAIEFATISPDEILSRLGFEEEIIEGGQPQNPGEDQAWVWLARGCRSVLPDEPSIPI
jgi:hypothetical protein